MMAEIFLPTPLLSIPIPAWGQLHWPQEGSREELPVITCHSHRTMWVSAGRPHVPRPCLTGWTEPEDRIKGRWGRAAHPLPSRGADRPTASRVPGKHPLGTTAGPSPEGGRPDRGRRQNPDALQPRGHGEGGLRKTEGGCAQGTGPTGTRVGGWLCLCAAPS